MQQEHEAIPRRRRLGVVLGAVLALPLGTGATAVAAGGGGETAATGSAGQTVQVQDERDGRDCPRHGGQGGGEQGGGTTTPAPSDPAPAT